MFELQLLLLLMIANGAPIVAHWLFGRYGGSPLDGGWCLSDGQPLFGKSKTLRGILAALLLTTLAALMMNMIWPLALLLAFFAMLGDLLSSFIKRRLAMPTSSRALGLDQIPESLLPLLACRSVFDLSWPDLVLLVLLFLLADLLLSRWLYRLHIRKHPY